MTWVKMDDRYPDHPKVAALTDGAYRLWTTGIAYCSRHLTDGLIAEQVITRWGVKHPDRAASELVSGGLWRSNADGYEVVNYLNYQRSKAEVENLSAKRSEAGKKGANAKHGAGKLPETGQDVASTVRPPDTESDPETESSSSSVTASPPASAPDDEGRVWIELARLRAEASPVPVVSFTNWSAKVIEDDRSKLAPALIALRLRWPNASPEDLARALFDGTQPPTPPRERWCSEGHGPFAGIDAWADHRESCEGSEVRTPLSSPDLVNPERGA